MFAFLAMVLVGGFSSCEKNKTDEDNNTTTIKNEIVLEGETSVIKGGFIEDYGQADPNDSSFLYAGTNYDVYLYTESVTFNTTTEEFSGEGLVLYFESFSINGNGIATGKYTYNENSLNVNTFDLGLILEAKSVETFEDAYAVTNGIYDVTNNGNNNYEIKGTLTLLKVVDGTATTVTFSYKGTLPSL